METMKETLKMTMILMMLNLGNLVTKMTMVTNVSRMFMKSVAVLDTAAFERLLGPCMETMKEGNEIYQQQIDDAFRS